MKKLVLVLAIVMAACSSDDTDQIENSNLLVKEVTLNMQILMSSETTPIMQRRSSCAFPELYSHKIETSFNVYLIPTAGGESFEFTGIVEGKNTFEIPLAEYRIVVTNSDKKYREELPVYSDVLYLFGENVVNFKLSDTALVNVTNDYASVMVVNNSAITSIPELDGRVLSDIGSYYNIYTRAVTGSYLGINNHMEQISQTFTANEVYRFMICPEGSFSLVIDSNILTTVNDVRL